MFTLIEHAILSANMQKFANLMYIDAWLISTAINSIPYHVILLGMQIFQAELSFIELCDVMCVVST